MQINNYIFIKQILNKKNKCKNKCKKVFIYNIKLYISIEMKNNETMKTEIFNNGKPVAVLKPKLVTMQDHFIYQAVSRPNSTYEEYENIKIVTFDNTAKNSEKYPFGLNIWRGRQKFAYVRYVYPNINDLNKRIETEKGYENTRKEYKAKAKKELSEFLPSVKIGDIFYTCWGYDQTNVDFYQVIDRPSNLFVMIQEIGSKMVPNSAGLDSCHVIPIKSCFHENSKPFKKKILNGNRLNMTSYANAYLHKDGETHFTSWGH